MVHSRRPIATYGQPYAIGTTKCERPSVGIELLNSSRHPMKLVSSVLMPTAGHGFSIRAPQVPGKPYAHNLWSTSS